MKHAALLLTLLSLALPATAQKVFRCGADGREYSQTPCKDSRPVDADDPRTAGQRQQALANAKRDEKLATQLERERQAREVAAATQGAAGFHTAPPASAASTPTKAQKKKAKKKDSATKPSSSIAP